MMFNEDEFLQRLNWLRLNLKNYSQREISEALGWRPTAYSDLEGGRKRCSVKMLAELSDLYSVDPNYLMTGDPSGLPAHIQKKLQDEVTRVMQNTRIIYRSL